MADVFEPGDDHESASEFLLPYIQSGNINFLLGSGASFPAMPTAGNIEKEIDAFLTKKEEISANAKCVEFIENINAVHASIGKAGVPADVSKTLEGYTEFVRTLDRLLFSRKNLLLPRQANIFTTNYDMFVECAASLSPSVILNDGFDRTTGLTNRFPFTPERYFDRTYRSGGVYEHEIEIPTINLIKLHGSLSWRSDNSEVVFEASGIPALSKAAKADAGEVTKYLERHFLILPNMRKFHTTLMDRVYYDLLRLYANALDRGNAILFCFGFSFADEHIFDITRRALRNPTAQLIIFAFDQAAATDYQGKFAKQRNAVVIAPPAGKVIDFALLNKLLASVLPERSASHGA
ncbi:SIR2 family protein [Mesorhizobium xinjiangense]|uniref:SIR2 family protein n=1 Tax=Mesorhizobium xinjiangense TaxID=2678685 RepID=UPI0012EE8EE9|nr:SIR2 family protein [Mesorhizobium xinjiangense]